MANETINAQAQDATATAPDTEATEMRMDEPKQAPQPEAPKAAPKKKGGCMKKGCIGGCGCLTIPVVILLLILCFAFGRDLLADTWAQITGNTSADEPSVGLVEDVPEDDTDEYEEIEEEPGDGYWTVFYKWNECMNEHESNKFINLYAGRVSYYNRTYTPEEVMNDKFGWFGRYPEMNERIHDEQLTQFSDTHVRIDYEYDRQKDYESNYITGKGRMELQYIDGKWLITYENVR